MRTRDTPLGRNLRRIAYATGCPNVREFTDWCGISYPAFQGWLSGATAPSGLAWVAQVKRERGITWAEAMAMSRIYYGSAEPSGLMALRTIRRRTGADWDDLLRGVYETPQDPE